MDRLFFDTNVLLDVLERRAPWYGESFQCLAQVETGACRGAWSALSLANIAYTQKAASVAAIYQAFQQLRRFLEVAPMAQSEVDAALGRKLPDLEEGLQLEAALAWKATHLLTRNERDFPGHPDLFIQSPADYLARVR